MQKAVFLLLLTIYWYYRVATDLSCLMNRQSVRTTDRLGVT